MPLNKTKLTGIPQLLPHLVTFYASQTPNTTALICQNQSLTYKELDCQSSVLAGYLQKAGIQRQDFVAIHLPRSSKMIIAIIGIQKAGGTYVPIDIAYPKDRIAFMVEDAQAKFVLTHKDFQENIPPDKTNILCLDTQWEDIMMGPEEYNEINQPSDLAYMIYTSGSTGKPKGVMISHENVFNQLEGQEDIAPGGIEKMLLTCSISFDVSVLTVFWTLYQGATLVIPGQDEEKDITQLSHTIRQHQVTHILTLPSLLTLILDQAEISRLSSLRLINVSGEVCPSSLAKKHQQLLPNCQLYNLYGPTEATVNCTFFKFPDSFSEKKVPIGIPIKNYEIFILNKQKKEVSGSEIGEIYIGGSKDVVGKGYWNRPELSAERFIENPFKNIRAGEILYKTGDLARWQEGQNIEFLGRSDFQIKFNGFRIELGEIENAISQHKDIKENVVLLRNQEDSSHQKLVAYATTTKNKRINTSRLRSFLGKKLPEYMIPATFVFLDKMPLTPNGKLDRKALPEPPGDRPELAQTYQAPLNELEEKLTRHWEELIRISPIGRSDKFFELGGNSIQAALFIGQLQKELDTSIFVTTLFDYPTIASYAAMLEKEYPRQISKTLQRKNTAHLKENSTLNEDQINRFQQYIPTLSHLEKCRQKNKRAIFILAPPRSGTSLLSLMLAGHPSLIAFNELKLMGFNTLRERNKAYSGKIQPLAGRCHSRSYGTEKM